MATISPLRRRMIDDMMVRNLSPATQQSYIYAVAKFSRHFNRSPERLGLEDVRAYQLHLIAQKRSWSHINQVACALRFFYGITLSQSEAFERIVTGREPHKLPVVLSADEIVRFLEAIPGLRNRAALTTAYGAGLRVGEVARLQVSAIDSRRMLIRVEHGKGGKDRYVMLSAQLLQILARLLASSPAGTVAIPRSRSRQAGQCCSSAGCLPNRDTSGRTEEAGHRSCAPAQFCHPPAGERHRYPHHPGLARARPSVDDCALCAGRHQPDRPDDEPARSFESRGDAARLSAAHALRAGGGGHLPPPR